MMIPYDSVSSSIRGPASPYKLFINAISETAELKSFNDDDNDDDNDNDDDEDEDDDDDDDDKC